MYVKRASTRLIAHLVALSTIVGRAQAATYFVDSSANDPSENGSFAHPWNHLSDIAGMTTSDKVFLKCGSRFQLQRIVVNWGGTATDHAVLGAYYDDGGAPAYGVNGDGMPVIEGVIDTSSLSNAAANNYPAHDSLTPLVDVQAPYVQVTNVKLLNSGCYALRVGAAGDNYILDHNWIESVWWGGIYTSSGAADGLIEWNYVRNVARKMEIPLRNWAGAIVFRKAHRTVCRYNWIYGSYGEGIGTGFDSQVYGNLVGNFHSVGIYNDGGANTEIAYNLLYGTNDYTWDRDESPTNNWYGRAIELCQEPNSSNTTLMTDFRIHHNYAISVEAGFKAVNKGGYDGEQYWTNADVYNNFWIDCLASLHINSTQSTINGVFNYRNNISLPISSSAAHVATYGSEDLTNHACDHNLWANKPAPGSPYASGTDQTALTIGKMARYYDQLSAIDDLTMSDIAITAGAAEATGASLGTAYDQSIDIANSNLITANNLVSAIVVALMDQDENGSGWDIGPQIVNQSTCGNGELDEGEVCDPGIVSGPGFCPSCDDGVACTVDTMTGAPGTCDVRCENLEITSCVGADGCCPSGCVFATDSDCPDSCGSGTCEPGLDETCATCLADCGLVAGELCCDGVVVTGDCCLVSDCLGGEVCVDHYCQTPSCGGDCPAQADGGDEDAAEQPPVQVESEGCQCRGTGLSTAGLLGCLFVGLRRRR